MTIASPSSLPVTARRTVDSTPYKGHWLLGNVRELRADFLSLYEAAWREKGDYIRVRALPGYEFYLIAHPEGVEHVLQKNSRNYRKPDLFNRPVRELFGDGLVTSEGDFWRSQRKLIQPAFARPHLLRFSTVIAEAAESLVRRWQEVDLAAPIDVLPAMMRLSLGIASVALFSHDMSGEGDVLGNAFRAGFAHISKRMNTLIRLPRWFPTPDNRDFASTKSTLHGAVTNLIERRRALPQSQWPADLLSTFLAAQDDQTHVGMTNDQVRIESLTVLTASHDTVGAALSWSWYRLAQLPDVQESLNDELSARLGGRTPTAEDLPHLPLTRAIFEESMRLHPPAPAVLRESIGPDDINGFRIKKKGLTVACQYLIHRHPEFWDDPLRFNPERFMSAEAVAKRPKLAYFPFGAGPRVCVGSTFAMTEGPLVLATIARRFRLELAPGQTILPDTTFTLRPKPGVKVFLRPR